ncbi:hypothetical protein OUZ56_025035 [Daphnia magna]|uniref:Uncharacterized protein n=1 Tax=Daphnia magna TaxID=35525 RepID=A0ABQ9ZIM7_9CRUS|nr:hypothetical protein OUZ56_025035 [Daphnia magna]
MMVRVILTTKPKNLLGNHHKSKSKKVNQVIKEAMTFTCWAVLYDNIPQLRVINKGQQAYTETNTTLSHTQQVVNQGSRQEIIH